MPMMIRGVMVPEKDLNQRFAETYIEVKTPDKKDPYLVHVGEFGAGVVYTESGTIPIKILQIVREFPELGAVEFDGTVHYLSRLPLRQWSRGLSHRVLADFCRGAGRRFTQGLNMDQAKAVFYPRYTKLQEGLMQIGAEQRIAFAYNPKFWFSGNKNRAYLWYEDVPVGEVHSGAIFFNEQCLSLKQEVKDEFKNVLKTLD